MSSYSGTKARIVVGFDGSASSRQALRWATTQAALTGAPVEAVSAWHFPYLAGSAAWAPVSAFNELDFAETARKELSSAVSELGPAAAALVTVKVVQGDAAQVLVDASAGAELLVVGSRGHGGFAEALLGSIGQHCVHHARCPVVIIRGMDEG